MLSWRASLVPLPKVHKKLNVFDTGVQGEVLTLHIGLGCGLCTLLQVVE